MRNIHILNSNFHEPGRDSHLGGRYTSVIRSSRLTFVPCDQELEFAPQAHAGVWPWVLPRSIWKDCLCTSFEPHYIPSAVDRGHFLSRLDDLVWASGEIRACWPRITGFAGMPSARILPNFCCPNRRTKCISCPTPDGRGISSPSPARERQKLGELQAMMTNTPISRMPSQVGDKPFIYRMDC